MKKFTITLVLFTAICLNSFSQTVVDLGWDWTGTADVEPTSGTYITSLENVVYPGTENEIVVSCGGDSRLGNFDGDLYVEKGIKEYEYLQVITDFTGYVELSLTDNSAEKKITAAKINGTSNTLDTPTTCAVLFSDRAPFDEQHVVDYKVYELAAVRAGNAGVTLDIPERCKSFRLYRKAMLEPVSVDPVIYAVDEFGTVLVSGSGYNFRIGYFAVTLEDDDTTNISFIANTDKEIVATEYYDIMGRKITNNFKGIVLVKTTYSDGTYDVEKSLNK